MRGKERFSAPAKSSALTRALALGIPESQNPRAKAHFKIDSFTAGLKSVRENLCRPYGTRVTYPTLPSAEALG
jgi:hypothetical protein